MKTKGRQWKITGKEQLMRMVRQHAGIKPWSETEKDIILATTKQVKHMGIAAALLGISRTKLHRKLKDYRSKHSA